MLEALGPDLAADTRWMATDGPFPEGELAEIFASTPDVHKALHFLPVYESALSALRSRPIRMMEIGVYHGGSMQMWRQYLHPESVIVGIDIDPAVAQFDRPSDGLHVRIGGQQDIPFLERVVNEFGTFDVILDDGSHMTSHMVDTFRYLFPNGLAPGGVYIVEDIGTNYLKPWRDDPMSFVDFTKWLIDAMHAHCQEKRRDERHFRVGDPLRVMEFSVPLATTLIEKIEFSESIAVIHRADGQREVPRTVHR
jgi:predicted O-methyltransferase YrrM